MADQQRRVSLIFEANTNQAKSEINSLITSLQKIQSMPSSLIDPTGIREASKAALELQNHIQKAINVDTGKLDLSRFATSLSTSNKSLEQYRNTLTRIGPEGSKAFKSLVNSINNAEVSTVRLTKGMKDFLVTMKNTVKWQISSSIMHNAIATIQTAYGYAKSLDSSLNDIRIVTGQSAEEMAKFAEQANRSAKALSTTTTKYTEAALIFYQQGLNDKDVRERTDAVIKMANVTGEASKEVSSYMTAIWNNFDDGSKSLEYYADVITKLGAATAASSAEIAGGLEKFAAVGNTIGLSYEYATAMLTTIIDKTRQSEDVVGTALKTILARIQGLNLGETLEDGTTLNKYSEALAKVGVNIKDASGQIKDMDSILDELGSKWGTLSKDTQIALAQVVGGVRQYNQIISLMSNWSAFKQNVDLAETSAGSLNEQAEIHAESWEAARDRVRAAAEGIYDALINEDVFIKLDDIFTHLLNGISGVVKGMGGMIPIMSTIGGFITQKFAKEMPVALNNMAQNLAILSGKANNNALNTQRKATASVERMRDLSTGDARAEAEYEALRRVSLMREKLIENQHRMSSAEIEQYQMMIKNEEALGRIMVERQAAVGLIEKETQALKEQVALRTAQVQAENAQRDFVDDGNAEEYKTSKTWDVMQATERDNLEKQLLADEARSIELKKAQMGEGRTKKDRERTKRALTAEEKMELQDIERRLKKYGTEGQRSDDYYNEIEARTMRRYKGAAKEAATGLVDAASIKKQKQLMTQEFKSLFKGDQFSGAENKVELLKQKFLDLKNSLGLVGTEGEQQFKDIEQVIVSIGDKADLTEDDIKKISDALDEVAESAQNAEDQATEAFKNLGGTDEDAAKLIEKGEAIGVGQFSADRPEEPPEPKIDDFSSKIAIASEAMGTLMSAYGTLNAIIEVNKVIFDEDAGAIERIGAAIGVLTSVTMTANGIISFSNTLKNTENALNQKGIAWTIAKIAAKKAEAAAEGTVAASIWGVVKATTAWMATNPIGWILAITAAVVGLGVVLANKDWSSDKEKKLDKLKEQSEALSKAQENLEQKIKDVESAWANYQDMVSILDECTAGTEAWNQALLNCNQSVLTLLDMSPELAQFIQYGENGQITLGGVGYEDYIADLQRKSIQAQAIETIASTDYSIEQLDLYGTDKNVVSALQYSFSQENLSKALSNLNEDLTETEYDDIITSIFEAFGDNFENAIDFIVDSGLVYHRNFAKDMYRVYSGDTIYESIADYARENKGGTLDSIWGGNSIDPRTLLNKWSQNIALADNYEAQQRASMHILLKSQHGYNENYLDIYEKGLREEITAAINDTSKEYYSANKSILEDLMENTFGGAEGSYSEMSEQAMRFALATNDVISNIEILSSIINDINDIAIRSTELGKELLSASGDVSKIGINTQVSEMTSNNIPLPSSLVLSEEQNASRESNINSMAALVSELDQAFTIKGNLATVWDDAINQVNDFIHGNLEEVPNLDDLVVRSQVDKTQLPSYQRVQIAQSNLSAIQEKYDINQMTEELGYTEQQNSLFASQVAMLESDLESEQEWLAVLQEKRSKYDTTDYTKAITDQEAVLAAAIEELGNLDPLYGAMKRSGVSAETLWIKKMAGTDFTTWNLSEEDAALLNNAKAEDIQSRTNDAWMIADETMSAQLDVIAEAQVKLDNLRGLAEISAKNQEEVAKLDEQIAEQEALILDTQTAIELAKASIKDVESQRAALETAKTEIANAEAELSSAEAALETEYTEAEAQMETAYQQERQQAIWNKYVEIYEQAGLIIPEHLKTLGEDLSFDDAYAQAYEIFKTTQDKLDSRISELESDIANLDVEAENIAKDIVETYFDALGLSLEEFLTNNSNYTVNSLYSALGDLSANPELALDLQAAQYQNRYGDIFGEDASASDIISRGQELDSRAQLYTMLQGENHNLDLNDDVTFNYIRDLYGLVGETAEEVFGYLEAQVITAKNMAAQEWTSSLGDKYAINYNKETGQFEGAGAELSSFQAAQAQGANTTQIDTMGKLLADIKGVTTEEAFDAFNDLIGTMIESSQNFDKVMTIIDKAREKMVSLGRQLTTEELEKILVENETSVKDLGITLEELTISLNGTVSAAMLAASAFDNLTSSLSTIKGNLKGLTKGTILDKDAWSEVKESIPEEYKDLFLQTAEGGATFIGSEEQGQELYKKALLESGIRYKTAVDGVEATRTTIMGEGNTLSVNGTAIPGSDLSLENIQTWMLSQNGAAYEGSALESILKALGQEGTYQETVEASLTPETSEGIQWSEAGNAIANAILTVLSGNYTNPDEASQVLATSGADRETVEQWNKQGLFTDDAHYQYAASEAIIGEYNEIGISSEEIQNQIKYLQEFADVTNLSQSELTKLASSQLRFNRGVENGQDNISDWIKELKNGEKSSKKYQDAQEGIIDTFGDILDLNWDKSAIKEFAESGENLELMEKALRGDEKALADLESQAAQIDLAEALNIETVPNEIASILDSISDIANSYDFGDIININSPDYGPIYAAFNELAAQAIDTGMSVEEAMIHAQNVLADLDLSVPTPEYEWVTVDVEEKAPDGFIYSVTSAGSATDAMGNPIDLAQVSKVSPIPGPPLDGKISYLVNKNSGGGVKSTNQKVGSRGRRGGGGGGGGGGGRRPTAEKKKEPDKERYHTITNQLEDLTDSYDKVSKAADRAFGKARIKLLQDQRKELQKLAAAQQNYIDEINDYYKQDLSNLDQVSNYVGFNIQLDENGTIANFDEIQNRMWEKYNSHINEKGEVIDMDEEAWKKYEEEWNRIMELINQYEETQDLRKEALQQLQDYINEIYDLQLEEITYSVEIDIEASEYALEILDYLLKQVEDDAWSAAEAIAYMGNQATDFLHQSQTYNGGITDILRNHTRDITDANGNVLKRATLTEKDVQGYLKGDQASLDKVKELGLKGEFTDEEIQSLKDYHSQLLDINQSLIDLRNQVYDTLLDSFSKFNEELQDTIDIMEHLTNVTDSYRNIIDLVGKKNVSISNALLESFSQIQTNQARDLVKAQKSRLDDLTKMRDEAEALRQQMLAEGNEKDAEEIEKRIKEMSEQIREATEDYTSALENALQKAEDQFKLHINNIIEDANQAFAGAMGNIQQLQDMFNLKNDTNDIYLKDFEKIYELNKLNRDITNSIDETSNIKAKEELVKLQAEINALEEDGVKVSQYQTEDLRRRYELKLAEIALNESQDAKSQVQMTRDADGNWNYIYTADENQVAEAEQNYEDKLYELQRANAEYINEMQDLLIQTEAELMAKIEEITNDQTLSLEEKQALIDEFTAQYTEKFNEYAGELNLVLDNNKVLYEDEWTAYSNLTGYKISADENYVDSFNETMLSTLTGFQTAEEFHQNFNDTTEMLLSESDVAFEEWEENVDEVFESAGLSSEDLASTLEKQFNDISNESENLAENIEDTGEQAVEAFINITDAVDNWYQQYSATIERVLIQNTALAESFRTLLSAWSDYQAGSGIDDSEDESQTDEENPEEGNDSGGDDNEDEFMGQITIRKGYQYWGYKSPKGGKSNRVKVVNDDRQERTYKFTQMDTSTSRKRVYIPSEGVWVSSYDPDGPQRIKFEKFDTGGYTGSWGRDGRFAMLHEKEIVLNKDDTQNLLSAVGLIRQVAEIIDLNAYSSAGFGSRIASAGSVGTTGTLEQIVHVTAEFPNATNKDEIYAAFGEIVNLASQYANRK